MTTPDQSVSNAVLLGPKGGSITFEFNPANIVISHSVSASSSRGRPGPASKSGQGAAGAGAGAGSTAAGSSSPTGGNVNAQTVDQQITAAGITTIAIRGVTFAGSQVRPHCVLLHSWTVLLDANEQAGKEQDPNKEHLPQLEFKWGQQDYPVTLNQLTITYNRFTPGGEPVRALVDMTFNLRPYYLDPTNPTSGGPPGRRTHVLTGAETLAGLSTQTYGSPGRWRQIAAANGIKDPLRVPPGTTLYLPSTEETGR